MRFPRMQNLCDAPEIPLVTAPSLTPEFIDAVDKAEKAANDLRDSLNGSNRHVRRRTT